MLLGFTEKVKNVPTLGWQQISLIELSELEALNDAIVVTTATCVPFTTIALNTEVGPVVNATNKHHYFFVGTIKCTCATYITVTIIIPIVINTFYGHHSHPEMDCSS